MPRRRLLRLLLGSGVACGIPAVIAIVLFTGGGAEADAFQAAPRCVVPSHGGQANCVSVLAGTITNMVRGGSKFLPSMTVAVGDTTATFGYERSPFSFVVGGGVATGWWACGDARLRAAGNLRGWAGRVFAGPRHRAAGAGRG